MNNDLYTWVEFAPQMNDDLYTWVEFAPQIESHPRSVSDDDPIFGDIVFPNIEGGYTCIVNIFDQTSCDRLGIKAFPLEKIKDYVTNARYEWHPPHQGYMLFCDNDKIDVYHMKDRYREYEQAFFVQPKEETDVIDIFYTGPDIYVKRLSLRNEFVNMFNFWYRSYIHDILDA